jgi:hypothetical protein
MLLLRDSALALEKGLQGIPGTAAQLEEELWIVEKSVAGSLGC